MSTSRPDTMATTISEAASAVMVALPATMRRRSAANDGKVLSVNAARWNRKVTDPRDGRVAAALLDRSSGQSQR